MKQQSADDIKKQFDELGYYHASSVFTAEEIKVLEGEFDWIVNQLEQSGENVNARWDSDETDKLAQSGDSILHTHNVHRYSRHWLNAMLQTKMLDHARAVLGDDIILHHSKLFQKPAEHGAPFPMHQDWPYFPSRMDKVIAGIIHVSEATDEMGCLRVWPKSHKLGRIKAAHGRETGVLDQYPIEDAIAIEAKPGDVVFFHYLTLHGSMPNRSAATRKTVLVQMYAGEDEIQEGLYGHHINEQIVLSGHNHTITRNSANAAKD